MLTRLATRTLAPLLWPLLRRRGEQTDWRTRWDPQPARPTDLWIHTASLGEITPYAIILNDLNLRIGVTVTSGRSLAAVRQLLEPVADVRPLPLPGSPAMAALIDAWRPKRLVLLEADAWPDLLAAIPGTIPEVAVLGGRLNRLTALLWRRHARHIPDTAVTGVWTAEPDQAAAWRSVGIDADHVHYGFEPKLCAAEPAPVPESFNRLRDGAHVTVAGSLHPEELPTILNGWRRWRATHFDARLIIVPRHPGRLAAFREQGLPATTAIWPDSGDITVVASYGVLAGLYGLADVALVGGSWTARGGHNPLEAAVHGIPVVMGPSFHNQRRLVELLGDQVTIAPDADAVAAAIAHPCNGKPSLDSLRRQMKQIALTALRP